MKAAEWLHLMDAVPENPSPDPAAAAEAEARERSFRVAVPVTGGMDSTTLWAMAMEAGLPAEPVYVLLGQEYADAELEAATELIGQRPTVLHAASLIGRRWQHVIPRRNLHALMAVADWMADRGWWGEVWFGNLAGETPTARGDKSSAFLVGLAEHMQLDGPAQDVIVMSPLRALDKTDLVRWWAARDQLDVLAATKSCFDPQLRACGRCQTCFRKMVAFQAAGYDTTGMFAVEHWRPFVDKYRPAMRQALADHDFTRYSPARCRDTLAVIDAMYPEGK